MTLEELLKLFEERVLGRYYGKYEGSVTNTDDPLKIGRLKAKVPAVLGEKETGWALPCGPFGGGKDRGFLFIPEKEDNVWIEFAAGDITRPIWAGCWWSVPGGKADATEVPLGFKMSGEADYKKLTVKAEKGAGGKTPEAGPKYGVLRTKEGLTLAFDDEKKHILINNEQQKTQIWLDDKSNIWLSADADVHVFAKTKLLMHSKDVYITADKKMVLTAPDGVFVGSENSKEHLVLGDTFSKFYDKHIHPTGVGPSGPAKVTSPWTPDLLSKKHTTESG